MRERMSLFSAANGICFEKIFTFAGDALFFPFNIKKKTFVY